MASRGDFDIIKADSLGKLKLEDSYQEPREDSTGNDGKYISTPLNPIFILVAHHFSAFFKVIPQVSEFFQVVDF